MRNALKLAAGALVICGVLASGGTAQAASENNSDNALVTQPTADGFGEAYVWWVDGSGNQTSAKTTPAYAESMFYDYQTGYTMNGWMERSTDGGQTWQQVSGTHALSSTLTTSQSAGTGWYYDGPGYLARACFQFTSWSGAAVHCSPAI